MQLPIPATVLPITIDTAPGTLYLPANPRPKNPWAWYAPAQGLGTANMWIATRLLQNNIAFATINVGESAGSPHGRHLFQQFYEHLTTQHDLSPTPVLWPQSRGGLQLYNWAAEHPQNLAAIAGTYTVVNLEEWTTTRNARIAQLYQQALQAYGLTHEQLRAQLPQHNPIDRLAPLAQHKIPLLHLHGDRDDVVPLEPHAGELVKRYLALGGHATLITIPGKGHAEIPEFFQSQPFLDFILHHAR